MTDTLSHQTLRHMAERLAYRHTDVDDLVQEAEIALLCCRKPPSYQYVVAWQAMVRYRSRNALSVSISDWQVRKLLSSDEGREIFRRLCERPQVTDIDVLDETADVEASLLHDEQRGMVRAALNQLIPVDREIVLLRYVDEQTFADIARQYHVGSARIQMRVRRAARILRRLLAA